MAEVRGEYPYQASWHEGETPMFVVRAETVDDFREGVENILEAWAAAHGNVQAATPTTEQLVGEVTHPVAAISPPTTTRSAATANRPIAKLPPEALEAMLKQKRQLCDCNDKWWDNRETKTKPTQPDFKCTKCNLGVWLTPLAKANE